MTDETPSTESTPDASAEAQTAPIQTPAAELSAPAGRRGIPAWAVISGAAAAGLVVVAGVGGYAIGQANGREASANLARVEAGAPAQPGGPMPLDDEGGYRGDGRGDGRGEHREEWGQGHQDEWWGQDGVAPQRITPQDLQRLLELLMQASGGELPFDGPMGDGYGSGPMDGSQGYRQGS